MAGVVNFLALSGIAVSIIAVVIIKLHRYQLTRQLKVEKAI
ncbi:hypothetical protein JCM19235_2173 [Vibrio maritimus]|uniref:Uncharacterized protein n=1 Tax=Vibrio maritimus TaxID=990268 RepID=A0A090RTJ0_9VIBR|nr:hypothetical protein JCM19235_2173 [Vibrio maritimus]